LEQSADSPHSFRDRVAAVERAPTAAAGLALGIASLGGCWEHLAHSGGLLAALGAALASPLLLLLALKFALSPRSLWDDLAHQVVGSVVPTFAMALMVVSKPLCLVALWLGHGLWGLAVMIHLSFFAAFSFHRARDFRLEHMIPSWFVPPIGIIVADVTFPGETFLSISALALYFGVAIYAVMLPLMLYRLIFMPPIPEAAKPTIAILAAPASLALAGYLSFERAPDPLVVGLLGGIAVLMTVTIYVAFVHLLRLPFSPAFAAFTFPMVISAQAMFALSAWLRASSASSVHVATIHGIAQFELWVATLVVGYVVVRYWHHYAASVVPLHRRVDRGA